MLGWLILLLAVGAQIELLLRLQRVAHDSGLVGYGRDGTNLLAVVLFWVAYHAVGFRQLPVALLAAMLTVLVAYLLHWAFGRRLQLPYVRWWLLGAVGTGAVLVAWHSSTLANVLEGAIVAVQPRQ